MKGKFLIAAIGLLLATPSANAVSFISDPIGGTSLRSNYVWCFNNLFGGPIQQAFMIGVVIQSEFSAAP